ncbi:MAG: hypothetical protein M3Z05_15500 [Gemmatimonadota bacterium]|nr:hypothetical protein [Gemmatimonadota bacterium]
MFIELVDALRCPRVHEESWLVASTSQMEARHIVHGTLGCPVCLAEYPIRDGVVDFRSNRASAPTHATGLSAHGAMRVAAMLDLSDATGFAVLLGEWGMLALELTTLVETPLIAVDPPEHIVGFPGLSVIRCDGDLPLASGAARAIAIDPHNRERADSAVRVTRTKGRILAPAVLGVPAGVRELVRDERVWVGEREAVPSPIVTLHVRRALG